MSARARGFAACAACLLSSPTLAQTIPEHGGSVWNGTDMIVASLFVVKNNSGLPITCARGLPDRLLGAAQIHWGDRFVTASGADVSFSDLSPRMYLFCDAPVEAKVYVLGPGQRYSMLPSGPGRIRLFRVNPGGTHH